MRTVSTLPFPALLSPAQMARADAAAPAHGAPVATLMRRAGWAVARAIQARLLPCPTLVLCGPGNNGGDGYVAARLLAERGWPVTLAALAPPAPGSLAADVAADWRGPMVAFGPEAAARAGLVIDAVFGAGLTRDLARPVVAALAAASRIVAIDIPSGVDGATGAIRGGASAAAVTVTFARAKPGHLLLPGRELCGELVLADIGLPDAAIVAAGADTWANGPAVWTLPALDPASHKYSRGHVTVLGGAAMPGAARLAADAARHAGAGLVTIAAQGGGDLYRVGPPGLIVSDAPLPELLEDARRLVWVCGPGLGAPAAAAALLQLLAAGRRVVADADTFSAFAGRPEALRGAAVLTPHAGEFARVFGDPGRDRLAAARAAAARADAVVLLKGSDTIIAAPDGRAAINHDAPPWLATAGSGDVLAGIVAGLLAQGMPAWDAACAGAWLHGRCGAHAGAGLVAEDLPVQLRHALRDAALPSRPASLAAAAPRL
jgi:hydroxyethylthiazole kinase-like uncharacterized protein yjeF